jgi:hypothetical protein
MATIIHGAGNDMPGTLTVPDELAIGAARALVRDGLRNEAWATLELPDGSIYQARNEHGRVIERHVPACGSA